jgi:parallel beta helix pectate lyase-like protein
MRHRRATRCPSWSWTGSISWVLLPLLPAMAAAAVDADAVARVAAGEITEAKASWWGFDPVDSTDALQAAIDSGAKRVMVENMGRPWIVRPINLAGDQEIFFEKGAVVEAKRGEFRGSNDSLFNVVLKQNVALVGYGAILRMHRQDYDNPPYKKAEWRNVINIRSCANVKVVGLTLAESGGDGIYLGTAKRGVTNRDVHIKEVICDGNYRQGISVISAENLLIEETIMKNTAGTPPAAGIDFEPNHADERIVNCVMRNCVAENNRGCGYAFYLPNLTGKSAPISLSLENCLARGSNRASFSFTSSNEGPDGPATGLAEFTNCTFADGIGPGITIERKPASGCLLRFVGCRIVDPAKDKPKKPAILVRTRGGNTEDVGGVEFRDCILQDQVQRPIMKFEDFARGLRLVDVTGTLRIRRGDIESVHQFTPQWLQSLHSGKILKRFPKSDTLDMRFEPVAAESAAENLSIRPFTLRRSGTYALHARQGDDVVFALRHMQVGNNRGGVASITALAPSGKKMALGEVPFLDQATLRFKADETGLYRISFDVGANKLALTSSNRPVCVAGEGKAIWFIHALGDFYFQVPSGTREFGLKIYGEGAGEAVAAAVFDPDGNKVWEKPAITAPEQFVASPTPAQTAKAWKVRFAKPQGTAMEDFHVELQGIPPFLSTDPNSLLKPVR